MDNNQNWSLWSNTTFWEPHSDDNGAHGCKYSDKHVAVKLNGTPC
jgi:hypothetical protein